MAEDIQTVLKNLMKESSSPKTDIAGTDSLKSLLDTTFKTLEESTEGVSKVSKSFVKLSQSVKERDILEAGKGLFDMVKSLGSLAKNILAGTLGMMDTVAGGLLGIQNDILKRTKQSMGGIGATLDVVGSTLETALKQTGSKGLGELGTGISTMLGTAMEIWKFRFQDSLAAAESKYAARYEAGGTMAEAMESSAVLRRMWGSGNFSRDEAVAWGKAMTDQGSLITEELKGQMVVIGKSFGIDASQMGGILDQFKNIKSVGEDAGELMVDSFKAARAAAEGTGIPTTRIQKNIMDATAAARFLNTDMKAVASTMQMMTKYQDQFRAGGISVREDSKEILNELAGGTNKWTEALHMYFGTKGGTEGSVMEGWAKSRFGTAAAAGLTSTAGGGFTMGAGGANDMTAQRIEVMKKAMMDASAGAKTDAEKLFMQMKVATDTFGMGEKTAQMLAMSSTEQLEEMAKDPAMMNEMKSEKQIMGELRTFAATDETHQRKMMGIAADQLKAQLGIAVNTALLGRATLGGLSGEQKTAALAALKKSTEDLVIADIKAAKLAASKAGGILDVVSGGQIQALGKVFGSDVLEKLAEKEVKDKTKGALERKQFGGDVYKNNSYLVGEAGPELFTPGSNGSITPNTALTKGGAGGQTTLNITLNVQTTNAEQFNRLLNENITKHVYS